MDEQFELLLIECLDALQAGVPLDHLLARFPGEADALRPILETAYALQDVAPAPMAAARVASRRLFLNQAATMRPARGWRGFRLAAYIVAAFVCLLIGRSSIIASAAALPGDTLYGVKQTVEQARLSFASDRLAVEREIDTTRRDEVQQLINAGRIADVHFQGPIEQIGNDTIQVAGLTVAISPATQLIGRPVLSRIAQVDGQVRGDRVEARRVVIQNTNDDLMPTALPLPTATATALPVPTATAPATATATAIATATTLPTLTATPLPTLVPTLVPTRLPTRAPTATPKPPEVPPATPEPTLLPPPTNDDNGNVNSNDNSADDSNTNTNNNDNGGDNGGNVNSNDDSGNVNGNDNNGSDDGSNSNANDSNSNDQNSNSDDGNVNDGGSGGDSNTNTNSNDNKNDNGDSGGSGKDDNKNDNSNTQP